MHMKTLITGITGQDGFYLADFLLQKGYTVFGLVKNDDAVIKKEDKNVLGQCVLLSGDLDNIHSLDEVVAEVVPDEVYNLAAQSSAVISIATPFTTGQTSGLGAVALMEAVWKHAPHAKFFQASSSTMFDDRIEGLQNERTPFYPRSPYAIAKLYAHWMAVYYRQEQNRFAVSGILFNHESPRRSTEFVTRKITHAAAEIKQGIRHELYLGNLDARRDWGFAGDYVEAMWLTLQQKEAHDYVMASGELHTVREFVEEAFSYLDLDWRKYVRVDDTLMRRDERKGQCGDIRKAKKILGWKPKVTFRELVRMMVDLDMEYIRHGHHSKKK
ncbi:MAG: GDPmannose 4,6-dehydratase [Parcubacteria group bacterium Gr01-1014_66]|nr:MAG: GDPmannose 4,6-dehydratase [Parcubacteria group bacterium Gr01-1014_66]